MIKQETKVTHKYFGVEGIISGPEKVQGPVSKTNSVGCYRHLSSGNLHKQMRNPLNRDVYFGVENHHLVPSLPHHPKSLAHSRVPECDGSQSRSNQV